MIIIHGLHVYVRELCRYHSYGSSTVPLLVSTESASTAALYQVSLPSTASVAVQQAVPQVHYYCTWDDCCCCSLFRYDMTSGQCSAGIQTSEGTDCTAGTKAFPGWNSTYTEIKMQRQVSCMQVQQDAAQTREPNDYRYSYYNSQTTDYTLDGTVQPYST